MQDFIYLPLTFLRSPAVPCGVVSWRRTESVATRGRSAPNQEEEVDSDLEEEEDFTLTARLD